MIRYYISAALVLAAIVTIETCFPLAAGCVASALVLTHGKTPHTD